MKPTSHTLHLNYGKKIGVTFKRSKTANDIKEKSLQTTNFKYAIGVFEGGGVKGAAYAGALDSCEEGGITFVGACGTSAGSIAAALVAAGATTDQIKKALSVNFSTFVTPGKTIIGFRRWVKRILQKHDFRAIEKFLLQIRIFISRIRFEKGISHSNEIHTWLNATLCEILDLKPGTTVKFSDLRKPLAVLATDISNNQAKIWTSESTPDDSVAYAVRCSCSIPLFFYPIKNEDSSYIDGGAIANLPLFLAKKLSDVAFVPIICFQFEKLNNYSTINNLSYIEFIYRIIGTTIKSNTDMQLHLNEEWHNITIDHCGVASTEFFLTEQQKSDLINAGRASVSTFIKSETLATQKSREPSKESSDTNRHYHLNETQRLISEATKEICFFCRRFIVAQRLVYSHRRRKNTQKNINQHID